MFEDKKKEREGEDKKSVDDKQIYYLDSSCKVSLEKEVGSGSLATVWQVVYFVFVYFMYIGKVIPTIFLCNTPIG